MKKSFLKKAFGFAVITSLVSVGSTITYLFSKKKRLKDRYTYVNFFSGSSIDYADQVFEGTGFGLMFSGLEISFLEASLKDNKAVLNLYSEFSGISIKVPSHWNVKVDGSHKKSGISNPFDYDEDNTDAPLLIINYDIAFSGIDIKKIAVDDVDIQEEVNEEDYFVDEGEDDTRVIKIKRFNY